MAIGLCFYDIAKPQFTRYDNLVIDMKAEISSVSDVFTYKYKITNDDTSTQSFHTIRIEIGDNARNKGGTIRDIKQIPTMGNKWGGWTSNSNAKPRNKKARGIIAWVAEHDTVKKIDDFLSAPESALFAGEGINLSFKSEGLPNIMRFWARGWARPYKQSEYDSLRYIAGYSADEVSPPWYEDAYQGKTIAPVLPPNPFNHTVFLDTLISQADKAQSLGWISDQNFTNELNSFLQQTRTYLSAGDSVKAATVLSDFVDVVEATNAGQGPAGATLTSEGYALLYFNARYLQQILNSDQK